ncbi:MULTISPECIES: hypothetical protein [unclassified Bradyrhizobium]|uniref:hypothetical protein n=1 Tax=unclassified Bradyrhizobium TaxID=2631580 RepID=UPI002302EC43|nr:MULTISPECIES: hypothetical protein [unclassified Bradyrhizobium]MDA9399844.1 hypothetical protein [Bradyrhizobium sp. CCBAU 45389]MDA9527266.1 hypothetical protein [Bradyrhizobium sp. CCBAU 25338]
MSGPKAFRIVTRAEIIAICRRNLARLDCAIESWTSAGRRNGTIEQKDIENVTARRDALHRLLKADRFTELQKQVAAEIAFLQADSERRVERVAEMEVRSKRGLRRSKAAAEALLQRLQALKVEIPTDIRSELSDSNGSSERLEAAMAKALLLLPSQAAQKATDRQRELATRLAAGERRATLQEWIARQAQEMEDPALGRVDTLLGELRGLGIDPSPFSDRVALLEAEPSARRSLIADSLLLDLAAAVKDGRASARLADELRARRAELSGMKSAEATSLVSEIEDALASPLPSNRQELVKRADVLIEEEFKAMAAAERRRAVLEGLASLGYEVSEGMATAWVQNGRIVLRKAANPGYGVELLGGSRSDLLQVRAVGIGSSAEARDANRDHDMETIWCGEFDRLKALVAKAGGNVTMEFARPVGQLPLKIVSDPGASQEAEVAERSYRSVPANRPT